jgi:hypothetical protein
MRHGADRDRTLRGFATGQNAEDPNTTLSFCHGNPFHCGIGELQLSFGDLYIPEADILVIFRAGESWQALRQ